MADITIVGSNMIDLQVFIDRMPQRGETVEAPDFSLGFGGKGSNQAVAAAKLGSSVQLITVVGNDDFGQWQLENYRQHGIDTSCVSVGKKASGVAPIFVDQEGENSIIIVKGANNELTPEKSKTYEEVIAASKLVVLQQEIPLATNAQVIQLANDHHVPVLLNPAPASDEVSLAGIGRVQFYAPNETELARITDLAVTTTEEIKTAAQEIVARGVDNVIVTLGAKGVLWVTSETAQLIPGQKVEVVDTTGAGDAFIGAFAHYYTAGLDMAAALSKANNYASLTITQRGTQSSYLTEAEAADLKKKWKQ